MTNPISVWTPIPPVFQRGNDLPTGIAKSVDQLYFLFSSVWGGTAGALLYEVLNRGATLPLCLTAAVLPMSWFVCSPLLSWVEGNNKEVLNGKNIILNPQESGNTLVTSAFFGISQTAPLSKTMKVGMQVGLLSLSVFSWCSMQKQNLSRHLLDLIAAIKKIISWIVQFVGKVFDFFTGPDSEEVRINKVKEGIRKQIVSIKKRNKKLLHEYKRVWKFIESDEQLLSKLNECCERTKGILLSLPEKRPRPSSGHPLVDEWGEEALTEWYYKFMKIWFLDFLEKNPDFNRLFQRKLNAFN